MRFGQVHQFIRQVIDGEIVNISDAAGVVSRHMEKPGEEHGNGCFKHKSKSITYSGCSDLVCGYDS